MEPRLKDFIRLFNHQEFFEAHEVLEQLWMETEGEVKNFYKGLIQCAVALVHFERGNMKGAHKVCRTACDYLRSYLPEYLQINTEILIHQMQTFLAAAGQPIPFIEVIE